MKKLLPLLFASLMVLTYACKSDNSAAKTAEAEVKEAPANNSNLSSTVAKLDVVSPSSKVTFVGTKPTGKHTGTINIKEGSLMVSEGNVIGGSFRMDMNSISIQDLEGDMKMGLEGHLKGTEEGKEDDFFNVGKFPTADFKITKVTSLQGDPDGTHLVYGDLTIKEKTNNVGFKAKVETTDSGVTISTPDFMINRANWDIKFMSKSFFDDLKDKFIDDEVAISINMQVSGS